MKLFLKLFLRSFSYSKIISTVILLPSADSFKKGCCQLLVISKIISTVILLPSADSFKKGCCHLHVKVCARITG